MSNSYPKPGEATAPPPRVSVVIPTFNRAGSLARLLEALDTSAAPEGGLEVVIVDDGSSDDTSRVAARFGARVLQQTNAGAAAARDRGWRAARGEIIVFIDDDCVPAPDAIATLTATLADTAADAVGAGMRPVSTDGLIPQFAELEGLVDHGIASDGHIRWLVTAGLAVRREALDKVGGFDLGFPGAAGEDVDLTLQLMEAGYRLMIEPSAVVYHEHRTRMRQLLSVYYRRAQVQGRLAARHSRHREDTRASVAGYFRPGDWVRNYQRYRRDASVGRSLALLTLRAAVAVPYAAGVMRPARIPHQLPQPDGPTTTPVLPRASLHDDVRRLRDTIRLFRNWPAVLTDVLRERIGRPRQDQLLITRAGTRIRCRNDGLSRAPVFQMFADDDYALNRYAREHHLEQLTILDIGAHVGAFTLRVCELLPNARVVSYEPSASSFAFLAQNTADNGIGERVRLVSKAVGAETGTLVLYEGSQASCISSTVAERAPRPSRTFVVPSISFDDVTAAINGDIDLVKIDCEGAEYQIVRGSSREGWRRVRRIVMEYHAVPGERREDLHAALSDRGFRLVAERPCVDGLGIATFERAELPTN